jgi:hypothetical protein
VGIAVCCDCCRFVWWWEMLQLQKRMLWLLVE